MTQHRVLIPAVEPAPWWLHAAGLVTGTAAAAVLSVGVASIAASLLVLVGCLALTGAAVQLGWSWRHRP